MSKILTGLLIAGAAAAVGVVASKVLKGRNTNNDFDDDLYDYPDPYDTDESIDLDIDDVIADAEGEEAVVADEAVETEAEVAEEAAEDAEADEDKPEEE